MVYDNQGRICLGKQLAEEMEYIPKSLVRLVYEGNKVFRLVPIEKLTDSDKIVGYDIRIDEKSRIVLPKEVRDMYTKHLLVYGARNDGYLYLEFQASKQEEKLASAIEALTMELKRISGWR